MSLDPLLVTGVIAGVIAVGGIIIVNKAKKQRPTTPIIPPAPPTDTRAHEVATEMATEHHKTRLRVVTDAATTEDSTDRLDRLAKIPDE